METFLQNVRYAIRQFRKYPGFTTVAVLTLAVGIGANAAIFSLVDQVLLERLPVAEPDRLVLLKYTGSDSGHTDSWGGGENIQFSYPMYRDLRDQNSVFEGMLAVYPAQVGLQWRNTPALARSEMVSGNYFSVLGISPALGRLFVPQDSATRGASQVAVLSYSYWTEHFGSDRSVINQSLVINGNPYTIIGVAQPGFNSVITGQLTDLYVPITMKAQITPQWDELEDRRSKWMSIVARLKPGISREQAEAGITSLWKSLRTVELQSIPARSERFREQFAAKSYITLLDASKGLSAIREPMRVPLLILMGMVGLLTLMATVNVGSLLLVRASGRSREMSVRYSLGASRGRVIGQLLVEGLALGIAGGGLGLALSPLLTRALLHLTESGDRSFSASPDEGVIVFCFLVSIVASLLFSLAPILRFYRPNVTEALKQQTGTGEISHAQFRRITVGMQIGLSLVLLVGAGLFSRTLANLKSVDIGFAPDHILTFQLDPRLAGYQPGKVALLYKRLLESLRALPGVQSVGMNDDPILANNNDSFSIEVPGHQRQEGERMSFEWERVTPEYFTTLRLPLIAGRHFTDADTPNTLKVALVNQSFVRKFFESPDRAIGRIFTVGKSNQALTIVGVLKDAKHTNLHDPAEPIFYSPIFQDAEPNAVAVYIRTTQAPEEAGASVRSAVAQMDSKLVIDSMQSMNAEIDTTLTSERLLSFLATSFGVVAAFITAIGLYGVLAFSIAQRTREIGVRMALGATRGTVAKMVLSEVLIITGCSVAVAMPISIALSSVVRNQLYGVSYRDPATLIFVVLAIAVVAVLSASVPARRAVQVQPITALRYE